MKTAKEITEYLDKEYSDLSDSQFHLVAVFHPEGYRTKLKTLEMIREYLLKWEYHKGVDDDLRGVEDAFKWVLDR